MEILPYIINWGTPLGLALFFCISGIGAGVFFWGISHVIKNNDKK
jgi:hypothetical protein